MSLIKKSFKLNDTSEFDCYVFVIINNEIETFWFKATDVTNVLGLQNSRKAIADHVREEWKTSWKQLKNFVLKDQAFDLPKNWQPHAIFVNEAGLWSLIMRSKKPQAAAFQKWMFEEVLPSLRKNYRLNTFKKYFLHQYNLCKVQEIEKKLQHGFVYWVTTKEYTKRGLVKIGCTSHLEKRLSQLNSATIETFYVLASFSVLNKYEAEKLVHEICKPYHLTKEFYKFENITVEKIQEIMKFCKNSNPQLFGT